MTGIELKYLELSKLNLQENLKAVPYQNYNKLYSIVFTLQPKKVLEIGTGLGLSTFVIKSAFSDSQIDTIEMNKVNQSLAKITNRSFQNINFINSEADLVLPGLNSNHYDLIFFDGFAPKFRFLDQFYRVLKENSILISANCHLKGQGTKDAYLEALQNKNYWTRIDQYEDTIVLKKTN